MRRAFGRLGTACALASCSTIFGVEHPTWAELPDCDGGHEESPALIELVPTDTSTMPSANVYVDPPSPALLAMYGRRRVFGVSHALGVYLAGTAPALVRHVVSKPGREYLAVAAAQYDQLSGPYLFAVACPTSGYSESDAGVLENSCVLEVASLDDHEPRDTIPTAIALLPDFRATTDGRAALVASRDDQASDHYAICYSASTAAAGAADAVHCLRVPTHIVEGEAAMSGQEREHCSAAFCDVLSIRGFRGEIMQVTMGSRQVDVATTYGAYQVKIPPLGQTEMVYATLVGKFETPPTALRPSGNAGDAVAFSDCIMRQIPDGLQPDSGRSPDERPGLAPTLSRAACQFRRPRPIAALDADRTQVVWTEFAGTDAVQELRVYSAKLGAADTCAMRLGTLHIHRAFDPVHVIRTDVVGVVLAVGTRLYTWHTSPSGADAGVSAPAP